MLGCILRRYNRPATDIALKRYSAKKFNLNKTKVYGNRRQIRVATLMKITDTIGVRNLMFLIMQKN